MAQRRSPNRSGPQATRRKYPLRNISTSIKRTLSLPTHLTQGSKSASTSRSASRTPPSSSDTSSRRQILVALHPNLRRLPSRLLIKDNADMRDEDSAVQVGTKRKRVASSNENARSGGRPVNGRGGLKRMRSNNPRQTQNSSESEEEEEEEASEMEVDEDEQPPWTPATDGDASEQDSEEDDNVDPSVDHMVHDATSRQLLRLRKDELVEIYVAAGLTDDAELMTKHEIADAIIAAREEFAEFPPSSPARGNPGPASSACSSDDNRSVDGDEEEEEQEDELPERPKVAFPSGLRRRATFNADGRSTAKSRPLNGRSLSIGDVEAGGSPTRRKSLTSSGRSSPSIASSSASGSRTTPNSNSNIPSTSLPLVTRLRSRKISNDKPNTNSKSLLVSTSSVSSSSTGRASRKGKGKQVEFNEKVQVQPIVSGMSSNHVEGGYESDLTDLAELEERAGSPSTPRPSASSIAGPSPRRLRSKGPRDLNHSLIASRSSKGKGKEVARGSSEEPEEYDESTPRRIVPMRRAKKKIGSLKESDEEDGEEVEIDEDEDEDTVVGDGDGEAEEDELEEDQEVEEVDELESTTSASPPPASQKPKPRRRKRSSASNAKARRARARKAAQEVSSDGDDEGEEEEEAVIEEEEEEEEGGEGGEQEEEVAEQEEISEEDEEQIVVEPRKLRNGKIVGEGDVMEEVEEEDEVEVEEEEGEEGGEEQEEEEAEGIEIDAEVDEDEVMDDDVDLTVATAKTLVRLRRDDLVRLCETRDLDVVGTKPQLAEALLEWRDLHAQDFSSPSSTGTARPPSTARYSNRRRYERSRTNSGNTSKVQPVLERSQRVHIDEPRTPPISQKPKEGEPELELDLESLGLDDREIAPDKLTKLEKIGSGGFKDVFIGKYRRQKVAISEFRGQLSEMDIKELKLLGGFDHPNIVRFVGVSIPENTRETPVMIVSELCANGDLFDYVRNVPPPTLHRVLSIMLDIAQGLEYLHTCKPSIIHRDCKSSNILITSKGVAKIADFGLAKVKQSTRSMVRSLVGTVNWQAPELWHAHPKYNHKVDVFSCAMVYWEMLQWHLPNKKFPWEGMNEHAIYEIVGAKRQRPSVAGLRKQWCPEVVDLMERMWAHEHQDRPTISEVVEELERIIDLRR